MLLKLPSPVTPSFAPSARPVCFVQVSANRPEQPTFTLLDAKKKPIVVDQGELPQQPPRATAAQSEAMVTAMAGAAIAIVEALFGFKGATLVPTATPTPAPTASPAPTAASAPDREAPARDAAFTWSWEKNPSTGKLEYVAVPVKP